MKCTTTLLLVMLISCIHLGAQQYQSYKGHILDTADSSAVPFVHIFFAKYDNRGAVSLNDGSFEVKTTSDDTLIISSMIYETKRIPVNTLLPVNNQIFLEAKSHELANLTILSDDVLYDILDNVIKEIPNNYPTTDHQLECYYQEYSIANEDYGHMLEAYMTIEDQGYTKKNRIARSEDDYEYLYAPHKIKVQQLRRTDDNRHLLINQYRKFSEMTIQNVLRKNMLYNKAFGYMGYSKNQSIEDYSNSITAMRNDTSSWVKIYNKGYTINGTDTLINIGFDEFPFYTKNDSIQGNPQFYFITTSWVINLSDYALLQVITQPSEFLRTEMQKDDKAGFQHYSEIRYRKIGETYVPFLIALDRGFDFMGNTQSDFVSRKLIVQEVNLGSKKSFEKGGKKVPRDKNLRELKFNYNEEFWSNIKVPQLAAPLDAVKAELNRYKNIQQQYRDNQKIR